MFSALPLITDIAQQPMSEPCVYRKPKRERSGDEVVCRGKAQFLRGCESLPARVAPAGSNRSSRGGNEAAEASGVEGHVSDLTSTQAIT